MYLAFLLIAKCIERLMLITFTLPMYKMYCLVIIECKENIVDVL